MVGWLVRDQGKKGQGLRRQKKVHWPCDPPYIFSYQNLSALFTVR